MPVRYRVVAFAVSLAALTYLDRVCISVLAPDIMKDLGLSRIQMSYVFSAFTLAYAAFEIPTAWWADRVGSRRVLARIVAWWSTFTIASGAAFNYPSLLGVRFLFGAGEAGAECGACFLTLDPGRRARHGAGHLLRGRAPVGRLDADAGCGAARVPLLARRFCRLRSSGLSLDRNMVSLVPG
jgi:MFS family permease